MSCDVKRSRALEWLTMQFRLRSIYTGQAAPGHLTATLVRRQIARLSSRLVRRMYASRVSKVNTPPWNVANDCRAQINSSVLRGNNADHLHNLSVRDGERTRFYYLGHSLRY